MSQPAKSKAVSFADLMQRACGYNSEPLAANLITQYMPQDDKKACVDAYNDHIEQCNHEAQIHERAKAACLLVGRPDLTHTVYELLLLVPSEP